MVFEGIRLASWNIVYITLSLTLSISFSYLTYWFSNVSMVLSLTLAVCAAAASGILYFILWVRYARHFAGFVKKNRVGKTFLMSVIGVIPNFGVFFWLPKVFHLTYGYKSDDFDFFLFSMFWIGFLIYLISSFFMPFIGLIGVAMQKGEQSRI